jgi:hypothetical protein
MGLCVSLVVFVNIRTAQCSTAHRHAQSADVRIGSSLTFEQGTNMKNTLALAILAVLLGGCAIAPMGNGANRDGYYQQRDYNRGDSYYRDRDRSNGNWNYGSDRYISYQQSGNGEPFQEHGH